MIVLFLLGSELYLTIAFESLLLGVYTYTSVILLGNLCVCDIHDHIQVPFVVITIPPFPRKGPGGSMSQVVGLPRNSYKPIINTAWVHARLCKLQKECTRLAAASDKVYQLLAHGRWFSPGTPVSSTTKTGRHDIAEIFLKVALNIINEIKSNQPFPRS